MGGLVVPTLIDAFMPRKPDSGRIDLIEIFRRVQAQMLSDLSVGGLFEHATSAGTATEHHWINLFERYLPRRYRAAPHSMGRRWTGRRSRVRWLQPRLLRRRHRNDRGDEVA